MKEINANEIKTIIPVGLELAVLEGRDVSETVLDIHKKYGFKRFMLTAPGKRWRALGFPPMEHFERLAYAFKEAKEKLEPYGIKCGWWCTLCIKSGAYEGSSRIKKADGSLTPYSNCPLDPAYKEQFSNCIARFAEIAKPAFIITEDDYSIIQSSPKGCFCDLHMAEFARRMGREYTIEELSEILDKRDEESLKIIKAWRELMKDTLVEFSKEIRRKLDVASPEIPMGHMQQGPADAEGDCTYEICKALAGDRHVPFARLCGTFYNGAIVQDIPTKLFHPIYSRQHMEGEFNAYHESDSYPSTRFFTSGSEMRAIVSTAYAAGFAGSTFQLGPQVNKPGEKAYGTMYAKERARFSEMKRIASRCELLGVEVGYDPFCNTLEKPYAPHWTQPIGLYGIPYTTKESSVTFWDCRLAKYGDREAVMKYLGKNLILDGAAAKALYDRGFGEYMGVAIGDDITSVPPLNYDLGAKEVIRPEFISEGYGDSLSVASAYAYGHHGKAVRITPTDEKCRVITDVTLSSGEIICPGMTMYKNSLGGTVVVLGMMIANTYSQSMLSYVRQKLFQRIISELDGELPYIKDAPRLFTIANEAKDPAESGFIGMLTVINLSPDAEDKILVHLPKKFADAEKIFSLAIDGSWHEVKFSRTENDLEIIAECRYLEPQCLLFK